MRGNGLKLFIFVGLISAQLQGFCATNAQNLALIENQVFGYENKNLTETERLAKIEDFVYGSRQNYDTKTRLKKLNTDLGLEPDGVPKIATAPTQNDYANEPADPSAQYPIVDNIENSLLHQTYKSENIYKRLDRLEKKAYGKVSAGSLSERVEKLSALAKPITPKRTTTVYDDYMAMNDDYNYFSPSTNGNPRSSTSDFSNQRNDYETTSSPQTLLSLERSLLGKAYPEDDTDKRLSRLEKKVLHKAFPTESTASRLDRLSTVASAQQSSNVYKENKLMQHLATGVQIGGIILMILAMVL